MKNNLTPVIKPNEILDEDQIKFLRTKDNVNGFFLIFRAYTATFVRGPSYPRGKFVESMLCV